MIPETEQAWVPQLYAAIAGWLNLFGTNLHLVDDRLYVGNIAAAANAADLHERGITHIVAATQFGDAAVFHPRTEFEYCVVKVQDVPEADLRQHMDRVVRFVTDAMAAGGAVLIHCNSGRSRSVTLASAYLTTVVPTLTPVGAIERIRARRPEARPNPGFVRQLAAWHRDSQGARSDPPHQ